MRTIWIFLTIIFLLCLPGIAQNTVRPVLKTDKTAQTKIVHDTLPSPLFQYYFGDIDSLYYDDYVLRRVKPNPDLFHLYTSTTYYNSPIRRVNSIKWQKPDPEKFLEPDIQGIPFDTLQFSSRERIRAFIDQALLSSYVHQPQCIKNYEDEIKSRKILKEKDIVRREPSRTPIQRLFKPDLPEESVGEASLIITKPNFWVSGGNGSFQLSQNSVSDNWYQGGESMKNLMTNVKLYLNYNDKEKIQFESSMEAKIGLNTVSSDTIRKYKINTDLLRLYSKLGIQAASKWYYTVSGEFNTQFFNNYTANSKQVVSSFLSPANLILSLGMDYKVNNNKINLSVFLSPVAYNLRYVGNKKVDETKFGLDPGKKFLHDVGSKFQTDLSWKIIPSITYVTRLYYFTNYEKVQADWENTFNFVLNRYLSTKLFVHTRFDDGVSRNPGDSYFQIKQSLSFGLNYTW